MNNSQAFVLLIGYGVLGSSVTEYGEVRLGTRSAIEVIYIDKAIGN
jgi:hypothetical protein